MIEHDPPVPLPMVVGKASPMVSWPETDKMIETARELDLSMFTAPRAAMSSAGVSSDLNDLRALCESLAARVCHLEHDRDKLESRIHTLETGEILPPDGVIAAILRAAGKL